MCRVLCVYLCVCVCLDTLVPSVPLRWSASDRPPILRCNWEHALPIAPWTGITGNIHDFTLTGIRITFIDGNYCVRNLCCILRNHIQCSSQELRGLWRMLMLSTGVLKASNSSNTMELLVDQDWTGCNVIFSNASFRCRIPTKINISEGFSNFSTNFEIPNIQHFG